MKAVKSSQDNNDDEGVVTSLVNLYEAYRYGGMSQEAVQVCHQLADYFRKLNVPVSASNYEKQATIIAKGEPLNRVVAVVDGQNYELEGAFLSLKSVW